MLRKLRWMLCIVGMLGGCGTETGVQDTLDRPGTQTNALGSALSACSLNMDFCGRGSTATGVCWGPWQYKGYAVSPCYKAKAEAPCPVASYQPSTCIRDKTCQRPEFGVASTTTVTRTITINPIRHSACVEYYPCNNIALDLSCRYFDPCKRSGVVDDYGMACWEAAYEETRTYPYPERISIDVKFSSVPAGWTEVREDYAEYVAPPGECTYTLANVPVWNSQQSPLCGTESYACTEPVYSTCRNAAFGIDAPEACGLDTRYSAPCQTAAEALAADPTAARPDLAQASCTTGEDLPAETGEQVRARYDKIFGYPARFAVEKDPSLQAKIIALKKLLFELRGDLLEETLPDGMANNHRGYEILALYDSQPDIKPPCGSEWKPPEKAAIPRASTFETPDLLPGQSVFGQMAFVAEGTTASGYAVKLGGAGSLDRSSAPSRNRSFHSILYTQFVVPEAGGKLEFAYRVVCPTTPLPPRIPDPGVPDYTTFGVKLNFWGSTAITELSASTPGVCTDWVRVSYDLAAEAGKRVELHIVHANNEESPDSYTLIDDVSFADDNSFVTASPELVGRLTACERLRQAPSSVADKYASDCLSPFNYATDLPGDSSLRTTLVEKEQEVSKALIDRAFSAEPNVAAATEAERAAKRLVAIQRRLSLASEWFNYATTVAPAIPVSTGWNELSSLVAVLRNGLGAHRQEDLAAILKDPTRSEEEKKSALTTFLAGEDTADRELLEATFPAGGSWATVYGPTLLLTLGTSLQSLSDRLVESDQFHDLGCRFRTCQGHPTESSQLHELIGALADEDELRASLERATLVRAEWKNLFEQIRTAHFFLRWSVAGVNQTMDYSRDQLEIPRGDTPMPLARLAAIVSENRRRSEQFLKTGLFDQATDVLSMGLTQEKLLGLSDVIKNASNKLKTAVDDYRAARLSLAQTLLTQLSTSGEQEGFLQALASKLRDMGNLSADLLALRAVDSQETARFSNLEEAYEKRLQELPGTSDYFYTPADPNKPILYRAVKVSDRKYTSGDFSSISEVSVPDFKLVGSNGDLVRIQVHGQWSPTCALQATGALYGYPLLGVVGAMTGPEGYYAKATLDGFTTAAVNTSLETGSYHSIANSKKACSGFNQTFGLNISLPIAGNIRGVQLAESSETCQSTESGRRASSMRAQTTSQGAEMRTGASFALGLRLKNTPFPLAPAGSLLAVRVPRSETAPSKLVDVQVLQDSSVVMFTEDADLYLVVNDLATCVPHESSLQLEITHLRPFGQRAKQLGAAMGAAYAQLRDKVKPMLSQGRLLPTQVAERRSDALGHLDTECNCDSSVTYPRPLLAFYDNWVDSEVARAERQVEINSLMRQMETLGSDARGIREQLQVLSDKTRLMNQITLWQVRALDAREIRAQARVLLKLASQRLAPAITLRYPDLDLSNVAELDELAALDWNKAVDDVALLAKDAIDAIISAYEEKRTGPALPIGPIAVAFPKPGKSFGGPWKEADPLRSQTLWNGLNAGEPATVEIQSQDIYQDGYGFAQLLCSQLNPVIRSAALAVARQGDTTNETLNGLDAYVEFIPNPSMDFALSGGSMKMHFVDPEWVAPARLPVVYGDVTEVLKFFRQYPPGVTADKRGIAEGLSPINSFELPAGALSVLDPYKDAEALVVIFDVEARSLFEGQEPLDWISSCK